MLPKQHQRQKRTFSCAQRGIYYQGVVGYKEGFYFRNNVLYRKVNELIVEVQSSDFEPKVKKIPLDVERKVHKQRYRLTNGIIFYSILAEALPYSHLISKLTDFTSYTNLSSRVLVCIDGTSTLKASLLWSYL